MAISQSQLRTKAEPLPASKSRSRWDDVPGDKGRRSVGVVIPAQVPSSTLQLVDGVMYPMGNEGTSDVFPSLPSPRLARLHSPGRVKSGLAVRYAVTGRPFG